MFLNNNVFLSLNILFVWFDSLLSSQNFFSHVRMGVFLGRTSTKKLMKCLAQSLSLKFVLIFANSADPDEMQHLPRYIFMGFKYTKGKLTLRK